MRYIISFSFALSIFSVYPTFADTVMVFAKANEPIAILGLSDVPGHESGCSNHIGSFVVDEIAFEGVSEIVGGIRVKAANAPKEAAKLIRMATTSLSNHDANWLSTLVQKSNKLLIAYSVCGNGGFHIARDIYLSDKLSW